MRICTCTTPQRKPFTATCQHCSGIVSTKDGRIPFTDTQIDTQQPTLAPKQQPIAT